MLLFRFTQQPISAVSLLLFIIRIIITSFAQRSESILNKQLSTILMCAIASPQRSYMYSLTIPHCLVLILPATLIRSFDFIVSHLRKQNGIAPQAVSILS